VAIGLIGSAGGLGEPVDAVALRFTREQDRAAGTTRDLGRVPHRRRRYLPVVDAGDGRGVGDGVAAIPAGTGVVGGGEGRRRREVSLGEDEALVRRAVAGPNLRRLLADDAGDRLGRDRGPSGMG